MNNIVEFRLKDKPKRNHVIQWLTVNFKTFPKVRKNSVGVNLFHGWRFIKASDGVLYFANCIHPGITQQEVDDFVKLSEDSEIINK